MRKISYSTFTIVDLHGSGKARIIEYDNPPFLLLRDGREELVESAEIALERWQDRKLRYSQFNAHLGDRIVFFSDGVSQAGMGDHRTPLGWGRPRVAEFVEAQVAADDRMSARGLSRVLVEEANRLDGGAAKDDTSACAIYFRQPRRLLVITGPPFSQVRDWELAEMAESFAGRKAICGGTTANILARLLRREIRMDLSEFDPEIPPPARMDGIDLITEGTLTLASVASMLESGKPLETFRKSAATRLAAMLLDSDEVHFAVGTKINQAHQDPNIPMELDLRRNVVRRIAGALERRYRKEVLLEFR
jgi:hypothetical protein